MNSKRYQRLACAVALLGVSAAALPQAFAAQETSMHTAAAAAPTDAPVLTADMPAAAPDERAAAWAAQRPAEEEVAGGLAVQTGKTIVEINFSGATPATEATARAALAMHVGDAVTEAGLVKYRDAIYATGYL